jgi:alkylation response protein AidB-like acyl-CoA dehydrogenase
MMDTVGNKAARAEIAKIKVIAPNVALRVLDRAIQAHGGAGVSDDFPLAYLWPLPAPFASPTAPTRSTAQPSPSWSSRTRPESRPNDTGRPDLRSKL